MPFDGLAAPPLTEGFIIKKGGLNPPPTDYKPAPPQSLHRVRAVPDNVCEQLGITPIAMETLYEHRDAQVLRYPGSWAHRHLRLLQTLTIKCAQLCVIFAAIAALVGVISLGYWMLKGFVLAQAIVPIEATVTLALMIAALAGLAIASGTQVKGPAQWIERKVSIFNLRNWAMPVAVKELIEHINTRCDQLGYYLPVSLYYGELRQQSVVLDPYIYMVVGGRYYALAIWDGDEVLHIAEHVGTSAEVRTATSCT